MRDVTVTKHARCDSYKANEVLILIELASFSIVAAVFARVIVVLYTNEMALALSEDCEISTVALKSFSNIRLSHIQLYH